MPRIAYGIALGADGEEDHREQMVDATADWLGRLRPQKVARVVSSTLYAAGSLAFKSFK